MRSRMRVHWSLGCASACAPSDACGVPPFVPCASQRKLPRPLHSSRVAPTAVGSGMRCRAVAPRLTTASGVQVEARKPRAQALSDDLLHAAREDSGAAESVPVLNLAGHSLARAALPLDAAAGMRTLLLTSNCLTSLEGLPSLPALQHLDVSFNRLTALRHLPPLPGLTALHALCNRVASVDSVNVVRRQAARVAVLDLRGNCLLYTSPSPRD